MFIDYVVRFVPGYGYLPLVIVNATEEKFRGDFYKTAEEALDRAQEAGTAMGLNK
jgi:hypothetical protein